MRKSYLRRLLCFALVTTSAALLLSSAAGQTYKVLHNFNPNNGDGWFPSGVILMGSDGTIYGTAARGGSQLCFRSGCGVVFQLTPNADGTWSESFVHKFSGVDGDFPAGPLIFDNQSSLYGIAASLGLYGFGTIYKLTPDGHGAWSERILHQFTGGADGAGNPGAGLVFDRMGNLYGDSSEYGGAYNEGIVYSMTGPVKSAQVIMHTFTGGSDGGEPSVNLTTDASGNVYGTAFDGGSGQGLIFEMSRQSSGWLESALHTFAWQDRIIPTNGVIFDSAGNLYGTTFYGGDYSQGAVYRLTHHADGTWTPTILHSFNSNRSDGVYPFGPLVFDRLGNLYGTTANGGSSNGGIVFELTPSPGGHWVERILHSFSGTDGSMPLEGVILDNAGNLYGTTQDGGQFNGGLVFEITAH